jgi:hypothetical protein
MVEAVPVPVPLDEGKNYGREMKALESKIRGGLG